MLQQSEPVLKRGGGQTGMEEDAIILLWETESMCHCHSHGKEETAVADVLEKMLLTCQAADEERKEKKKKWLEAFGVWVT